MGAPSLKKKKELNYRRGRTWQNCGDCDHLVKPGDDDSYPTCRIMGVKPGRAYRINKNNLCDAFDNE